MSDWTKETPTPGEWWLSVEPKKRLSSFPTVIRCEVSSQSALYEGARSWLFLTDEFFVGAQWKRVEADPTDPFALPISLPLCSFCAKPTEWQCPNCMIDKGMRYPLCRESAGSDCQLRHRAFHKCHLPR